MNVIICLYDVYVFIRFPKDVRTYGIDKQFLWGKSLLVTPVLDPGVDYVEGYFPAGLWYDYYTVRPALRIHYTRYIYVTNRVLINTHVPLFDPGRLCEQ